MSAITESKLKIVRRPVRRFALLGPMIIIAPIAVNLAMTTPDTIRPLLSLLVAGYLVGVVPAITAGFIFIPLSASLGSRFGNYHKFGALSLGAAAGGISSVFIAAWIGALIGKGHSRDGAMLASMFIIYSIFSGAVCGLTSLAPNNSLKPNPLRGSA